MIFLEYAAKLAIFLQNRVIKTEFYTKKEVFFHLFFSY
jgi:hypothetical protein